MANEKGCKTANDRIKILSSKVEARDGQPLATNSSCVAFALQWSPPVSHHVYVFFQKEVTGDNKG
jgi:hypothetical protein